MAGFSKGGDLLAANNLSDVASASTSLANLGGLPLAGGTMTGPIVGFEDKGGQVYNVKAYGATGNTVVNTAADGHMTSGSAVLTSASGVFTSADAGKTIGVFGAGASGAVLATTILSYQSATQVTLAANAGTTVTTAKYNYGTIDTTGIQAAITAANSAGGGQVTIPAGTFMTGTLTMYRNVTLAGAGIGSSTLLLVPGSGVDLIETYNTVSLEGTNSQLGEYNFTIRDLSCDGFSNATGWGIRIYGYGFILQNLRVRNFPGGNGIQSEWSTYSGAPLPDSMEAQIINVKCHGNYNGINWNGPHDSQFVNCVWYANVNTGITINATANYSGGSWFANCHSWGNTSYGYYVADSCSFFGCVADGTNAYFAVGNISWIGGAIAGGASFSVAASLTGISIRGVRGYNPVGSSVPGTAFAIGATTVAATNNTGVDGTIYVTAAGTVTAVSVNGVAVSGTMAVGDTYRLAAGGTLTLTYTVAPTIVFVGD